VLTENQILWSRRRARANAARRASYFLKNREQIAVRQRLREERLAVEESQRRRVCDKLPKYRKPGIDAARDLLKAAKRGPCMDCSGRFHPDAMDFDHREGSQKEVCVSKAVKGGPAALMREIAKCDLVCACCHRVRTANRLAGLPATLPTPEYEI